MLFCNPLKFLVILFLTCFSLNINATEFDHPDDSTSYYQDVSDQLLLRLYTLTKWNALDIFGQNNLVSLRPNGSTNGGVGFNYKDFGFGIAIGQPLSQESINKYGNTKRLDLQANLYKQKFGFDGYLQLYKGYYLKNPNDFQIWEQNYFPQKPDLNILSTGLNFFYFFNQQEFSYKAAYQRTQIQQKSAGSFITGAFSSLDIASTDNGFIPQELPDSISMLFDLKSFSTFSAGVSLGYAYTFVILEKFFINLSVIPGFGYQRIQYNRLNGIKEVNNTPAAYILGKASVGYENKNFFVGLFGSTIWRNWTYNDFEIDLATEQVRVTIGKRFSLKH